MLEHLRVSVHLVPEVLQHHRGGDGGEAEADEAEDKQEAERPHRDGEDVGWMSVGPGVKRRRITAAGESRQWWEVGKNGDMQESVCESGESVKVLSLRALRARWR